MTEYSFRESYFEGKWQSGGTKGVLSVNDPWTGESIARLSPVTASDIDRTFRGAATAQAAWAKKRPAVDMPSPVCGLQGRLP